MRKTDELLVEGGLKNALFMRNLRNESHRCCYFCGNKLDYILYEINGKQGKCFFRRGINGVEHLICKRCFLFMCKIDSLVGKLFLIFWKIVR